MSNLTTTTDQLNCALRKYGIGYGKVMMTGSSDVEVWQFYNGTQGSYRKVGVHAGVDVTVKLPVLTRGMCTSGKIVEQTMRLILVSGSFYEVNEANLGYGFHKNPYVTLPEEVVINAKTCELMQKIENVRAELKKLEDEINKS